MIAGVALFDYDNDGRLDIYFCNGATIPGLEKSRRELLEPALPQRSRARVRGRHGPRRRRRRRVLDGRGRGRLRQRRLDRPLRDGGQPEHPLPEPGRRDVRGRDRLRRGGRRASRAGQGLVGGRGLVRLRPRRGPGPLRRQLLRLEHREGQGVRGPEGGLPGVLPPGRVRSPAQHPLPEQRRRHLHRRLGGVGHRRARGQGDGPGLRRLRLRRMAGRLRLERCLAQLPLPEPRRRDVRGDGRSTPGSATSTRGGRSREWGPTSGTTTATGGRTSS